MAPLMYLCFRKVLLILLFLLFLSASSVFVFVYSESNDNHEVDGSKQFAVGGRRMLEIDENEDLKINMKSSSNSKSNNQTKLTKSNVSSRNQTKSMKNSINTSSKNQTKIMKTTTNLTKSATLKSSSSDNLSKSELKKLNSTSKVSKSSNSTKLSSFSSLKKSSDLSKNNKTTKPSSPTQTQAKPNQEKNQKPQKNTKAISFLNGDEDDLVSEFRDLPIKFQQNLIPDLERISTTSKAYANRYNKEITKGFKPIVGNKYAATIASIVSFAFIVVPLILVSLIFHRIKAYFSLQKILIFIHVYLSIYFSILCLSSLVTGLEPLKFFYSTSQSTYVCVQVVQTLGYILYLLMLLMYLILVFSTDCGLGPKMLGLAQMFVGYGIGLHYYVAIFHRVVLRQPPKTNWKIHGIYATCFLLICVFDSSDRRKKAYLKEGGEEGKKN